jgi:hypothetical protein
MASVIEYPDDPLRTFPTGDPYVRPAEFGTAGVVTYTINDARRTVMLTDVTGAGGPASPGGRTRSLAAQDGHGDGAGRLGWLLALGIVGILAANVAHGWSHGPVGAAVAAWPAASLAGSYELLLWLIRTAAASAVVREPGADQVAGPAGRP